MPKPDPTQERLDRLSTETTTLRDDLDKLQGQLDQLSAKFGPGTKFLVDLEERLVYDGTITATRGATTPTVVESLPGALHASYRVSAQPTEASIVVITNGEGDIPANGCGVTIGREYKTGPIRIEITLRIKNTDAGTDHPIKVKVWKRMGLG